MKTPRPLFLALALALPMSLAVLCAEESVDLDDLKKRAADGDASALLDLAHRFRDGRGVEKNVVEAMTWAHRAADAGNAEAMDFVGFAYLRGAVVKRNIHQGYNNCGSTACATFARFQGSTIGGWDFKKLCPSPLGTGTDWWHLLDASAKIGQRWKLITFTPDDAGFDEATAFLKKELDAGRPVVVDFKYIGSQYPGGFAGHTLSVCGYIAAENL